VPLLAFGVPNYLSKIFSSFKKSEHSDWFFNHDVIYASLLVIIASYGYCLFCECHYGNFMSKKILLLKRLLSVIIFLIGYYVDLAYFEVFYAWSRVHIENRYRNFMKEVFVRVEFD